jgi:hypothetical protein
MKIVLSKNHVAVLQTEYGKVVCVIPSTDIAWHLLEHGVEEHFNCTCTLTNPEDFIMPDSLSKSYTFALYSEEEGEEPLFETLTLTAAPIY